MNIIFFTASDLNNTTGGLERACLTFVGWVEENKVSYKCLNSLGALANDLIHAEVDIVFIVGHRSLKILAAGFIANLFNGVRIYWCPFWHDYRLEKDKLLLLYRAYDIVFKYIFKNASVQFYVSDYEKMQICSDEKSHRLLLPTFVDECESIPFVERDIDVLLYGRDVPHKQFDLVRSITEQLGLELHEIDSRKAISEIELLNKLKRTKYVFVPSLYESYCFVALEALSAGCTVLASENVMVKDLLFDHPSYHVIELSDFNVQNISQVLSQSTTQVDRSYSVRLMFSHWNCAREFHKNLEKFEK